MPHLTQDTVWESDKSTTKRHIQESQEVSPFQAGDQKAARHRSDNMASTNINKNIHNTQYIDDVEDEDDATEMAEYRIKPFEKWEKKQKYNLVLEHYQLSLRNDVRQTRIVKNIKTLISKGVSPSSAVCGTF